MYFMTVLKKDIIILISYIYVVSYCENEPNTPTKADDCSSHQANGGYCCFAKYKAGNICQGFGTNKYKYLKDYAKYIKKCYPTSEHDDCEEYKDFSID